MPEMKPKYSSESTDKLNDLQIDQLSKMLVGFHLQNLEAGKQDNSYRERTGVPDSHARSAAHQEANRGPSSKDIPSEKSKNEKLYRNPLIYAKELNEELIRENLTRKQLAKRHGVSTDRVSQWFCLLKLPKKVQEEVTAMGDYWDKKKVTERHLRSLR